MKKLNHLAIFASLIISGFYSLAAHADCENVNRQSYISAESSDQPEGTPGKRTWLLEQLAENHIKNSDDACLSKLYTTATEEAKDYWQSIKTKYSCNDTAASDTCPDKIWSNVKTNQDYISNVDNLAKEKIANCPGCGKNNPAAPLTGNNLKNIGDINAAAHAAAAAKPTEPDCSKISPGDRRGLEESTADAVIEGSARCVAGFVEGIWKGLTTDAWGSLKALATSLLHPIETFSSLKTFALKLATEPGATLQAVGYNIADHFGLGEDFICSNNKRRAEVICQMVTRIPTDIALTIVTKSATGWAAGKAVAGVGAAGRAVGTAAVAATDAVVEATKKVVDPAVQVVRNAGTQVANGARAVGTRVANGARAVGGKVKDGVDLAQWKLLEARVATKAVITRVGKNAREMKNMAVENLKARAQAVGTAATDTAANVGRSPLAALTKMQERAAAKTFEQAAKKFTKADSVEKVEEIKATELANLERQKSGLNPNSARAKIIDLEMQSITDEAAFRTIAINPSGATP